jgi:hypothetical protein
MALAELFAAAVAAEADGDDDDHLLPDRLCRAATRVLPVDGAGLSVLVGPIGRSPLGASSPQAARAERLQFTVGNGPCLQAHSTRQPVFVVEADIRSRWPAFADLLFTETAFRGIVSLPLRSDLTGAGAMDLFFEDPADLPRLDVFDALAVGDLITAGLGDAAVWSTWSEAAGPDWLHSPAALRRAIVWQAVGCTSAALDVDAPAALALLRGHAYAANRSVDAVAADVVGGRLSIADVLERPGGA